MHRRPYSFRSFRPLVGLEALISKYYSWFPLCQFIFVCISNRKMARLQQQSEISGKENPNGNGLTMYLLILYPVPCIVFLWHFSVSFALFLRICRAQLQSEHNIFVFIPHFVIHRQIQRRAGITQLQFEKIHVFPKAKWKWRKKNRIRVCNKLL